MSLSLILKKMFKKHVTKNTTFAIVIYVAKFKTLKFGSFQPKFVD